MCLSTANKPQHSKYDFKVAILTPVIIQDYMGKRPQKIGENVRKTKKNKTFMIRGFNNGFMVNKRNSERCPFLGDQHC